MDQTLSQRTTIERPEGKMASGEDAPNENFRRITDELLLLRSEHNDGNLTTLDELALHQSHLCKIEYINRACPNLRILLLQVRCGNDPYHPWPCQC